MVELLIPCADDRSVALRYNESLRRATAAQPSRGEQRVRRWQLPSWLQSMPAETVLAAVLFLIVTINYLHQAISLAVYNSLWMDEVLAVWAARLPDVGAVWTALIRGSEFAPPLFDLLLHALVRLGFHGTLAMRMPSIAAMYLAAAAAALLVKRRSGWAAAALAAAFVLTSGVFTYAVQARPYACVTALVAWALFLWDGLPRTGPVGWRAALLGLLLAAAVGFHFYAVVLVGGFAVAELCWSLMARRFRPAVAAAILLAGLSVLAWLPIIHAASAFLGQDVRASAYYGRPSLTLLFASYRSLFGFGPVLVRVLLCCVGIRMLRTRTALFEFPADPHRIAAALLLMSVPLAVFLFALIVTHSYADRYTPAGAIGFALLFSYLGDSLGADRRMAALAMLAALAAGSFRLDGGLVDGPTRAASLALVQGAAPGLPIVTGNGGRFLELMEGLPAPAGARLRYLSPPSGGADPTNQHEVERWAMIRPTLRVEAAETFVRATPCFFWFVDSSVLHDDLPDWMRRRRARIRWLSPMQPHLAMVESRAGSCNLRR